MSQSGEYMVAVPMSDYEAAVVMGYVKDMVPQLRDANALLEHEEDRVTANADVDALGKVVERLEWDTNAQTEGKNWDVLQMAAQYTGWDTHTDFEGFANPRKLAELVRDALDRALQAMLYVRRNGESVGVDGTELNSFIRDVLLHYCYETADQAGEEFLPEVKELRVAAQILEYLFNGSRWLLKVTDEQYQEALNAPESEEE
jgi:hypothetical protein